MASFQAFYSFVDEKNSGTHDFSSDSFVIALTNTAPVLTNTSRVHVGYRSRGPPA